MVSRVSTALSIVAVVLATGALFVASSNRDGPRSPSFGSTSTSRVQTHDDRARSDAGTTRSDIPTSSPTPGENVGSSELSTDTSGAIVAASASATAARLEAIEARLATLESRVESFATEIAHARVERGKRQGYSAAQTLGPPDTPEPGDRSTAWATAEPDAGEEWLEVAFGASVPTEAIVIHETFNPGAIVEVAFATETDLDRAEWQVIWSGAAKPVVAPLRELEFAIPGGQRVGAVRIFLDTSRVPGWNEIDAISRLHGNSRSFATEARASSEYGVSPPRFQPGR